MSSQVEKPTLHCECNSRYLARAFEYTAPPPGETAFNIPPEQYRRGYDCCTLCGHWFSDNKHDMAAIYAGDYVAATYGQQMRSTFERIISLPPERSDNTGRIARIQAFAQNYFVSTTDITLLDIGAGLGVFPHAAKKSGWHCTAIDPDPQAARHLREEVGVSAVCGDFMQMTDMGLFDVITLNKVLEHVLDPIAMLHKASEFLKQDGFIYIEIPDGEAAAKEGKEREEFFIEHFHVFSMASTMLLSTRAGLKPLTVERLQEPSTKFTIRAFLGLA